MDSKDNPDLCILLDSLQFKAAQLMFDLREEGNTTQSVIDTMVKGIDSLLDATLDIIKNKFWELSKSKENFSLEDAYSVLNGFRGQSMFEGVQNDDAIENYLKEKNWLVAPKPEVVKSKEVFSKATQKLRTIPIHVGYVVPFLSLLEKLLNMPEVLHCIDNPKPVKEGVFTSPLDAYYYQNHPTVKKFPGSLGFETYVDDVNLADTASTKPIPTRFSYWQLLNLYPELRSSTASINLLFCAQTEIVKQYGFKRFLDDYIQGVTKLSSEEGVTFVVMGQKRCFHGIHICSCGDNPASANLAGFKESHFAERLCRQCMGKKDTIYSKFSEKDFVLRSKDSHDQHVQELEMFQANPAAWPEDKRNPSVEHGVNSRSLFMSIPHCDVTKTFPQDLMHDVIHGTLKLSIVCLLNHVVNVKKSLSLQTINERIHRLAGFFGVSKPSLIESSHITSMNLRQSASETLVLAHILPFALSKDDDMFSGGESVCDGVNLKCYILRLNLLNLQMSMEFSLKDVHKLRTMTQLHHALFVQLYPEAAEIPKLHFEIHLATQILLFGPLRQHWCLRYEGKHAEFKRLTKILHCYTNICVSLSMRHQTKQAARMLTASHGQRGPYLKTNNYCGHPKQQKVAKLPHHKALLKAAYPDLQDKDLIQEYQFVVVHGVHYSLKDAFLINFENNVPLLGEIAAIYGHQNNIVFIYTKLLTEKFVVALNAYKVKHQEELGVVSKSTITHHHRIPFIKSVGGHYVVISFKSYIADMIL